MGLIQKYEKYFFKPQLINIKAINLEKEDLYVQNICRNYFYNQTSKNSFWNCVAEHWIKYLNYELKDIDENIPLLVTAEKIMKVLYPNTPEASSLYRLEMKLPVFSIKANRFVFPFYRHYRYSLTNNYTEYKNYLIEYFA